MYGNAYPTGIRLVFALTSRTRPCRSIRRGSLLLRLRPPYPASSEAFLSYPSLVLPCNDTPHDVRSSFPDARRPRAACPSICIVFRDPRRPRGRTLIYLHRRALPVPVSRDNSTRPRQVR